MIRKLMLRFVGSVMLALFAVVGLIGCDDKDVLIPEGELPSLSRSYIQTHFPDIAITQVWKDKDGMTRYEVSLVNGVYLEFDKDGNTIKIESYAGLPKSVIPEKIDAYVNQYFPDQKIVKWELDERREQEVTLVGQLELIFDLAGNFIRIDR